MGLGKLFSPNVFCGKALRNESVLLHSVKEEENILHALTRRKANWICHFLRRNCLLKTRH